jgi:ferrous iron transport protein B
MQRVPFFDIVRGARRTGTDSAEAQPAEGGAAPRGRLMVVGNPNVGKSVLFNRLTGRYVIVSNYPGTTVEVSRGRMEIGGAPFEVIDTPGMYSLRPLSDEERVGRALLLREPADIVVHVIDAKNLERMLPFTLQLLEAGLPVIVAVNMMDEAEKIGLVIDIPGLRRELGIPVIGTVALSGRGLAELKEALDGYACRRLARPAAV